MLSHLVINPGEYEGGEFGRVRRKIMILQALADLSKQLETLMETAERFGNKDINFRSTPGFSLSLKTFGMKLVDSELEVIADIFRQYGWRVEIEEYCLNLY